jgi:hypothetical protein
MFNQKVNYFTVDNPSYLNYSIGAPVVRAEDIHNCGTTINKYTKAEKCGRLPLQDWCSKNVAVESFAMRPIVNSSEYFNNINNYLGSLIINDYKLLKESKLSDESYILVDNYSQEPLNSFLQTVNLEVTNKLNYVMANSTDSIEMFKNYNPICEGFVLTDIDITTYQSVQNKNHFYHSVVFAAVNTTRYNTVSFKAQLYQDTTRIMNNWNKAINTLENSKDLPKNINNVNSEVYIYTINLLNGNKCVLGQEEDCLYKGYNLSPENSFSQLLNDNMLSKQMDNNWLQPNSLTNSTYSLKGNYDEYGRVVIIDNGPNNIEKLVKELGY